MKKFEAYGLTLSVVDETSEDKHLKGVTYMDRERWPPTRIIWPDNPFNQDVKEAKVILDFGCGVGRNLSFIMENTDAHYIGIEPYEPMFDGFWNLSDEKYKDRVSLYRDFDSVPKDIEFDVVVSTFVMMHLGYRAPIGVMDITDMTHAIMKHTRNGTVWILFEHEREEKWISRWLQECKIDPDVFIQNYIRWSEMLHRGADHHLIIWKETK